MNILVINGPNLNRLGKREPGIYGHTTLDELNAQLIQFGSARGVDLNFFQSNHEGALIDQLHAAEGSCQAIILNAGAYTHTSIALRDAIASISVPVVEVHLSNTYAREPFRAHSCIAPVCRGSILGFGVHSYFLAIEAILRF